MRIFTKLYLLQSKDGGHNELEGIVVRAFNARQARNIASANCGNEGSSYWQSPKTTTCCQVKVEGKLGVIISDFHAG